jgi:hypothetical protein
MLVTSIAEVVAPGIDNLLIVLFDNRLDFAKLFPAQAMIVGKFDFGLQAKLGFAVAAVDVDMGPRLLAREEVEAITILSESR